MAAMPTRKAQDSLNWTSATAEAAAVRSVHGQAMQGGVIADWHRQIELRFGEFPAISRESRGETVLHHTSRLAGYGALASGYVAVAWLLFG